QGFVAVVQERSWFLANSGLCLQGMGPIWVFKGCGAGLRCAYVLAGRCEKLAAKARGMGVGIDLCFRAFLPVGRFYHAEYTGVGVQSYDIAILDLAQRSACQRFWADMY